MQYLMLGDPDFEEKINKRIFKPVTLKTLIREEDMVVAISVVKAMNKYITDMEETFNKMNERANSFLNKEEKNKE